MAQGYVGFDPTKPTGTKFTQPEVRAEIAALAPTSPPDGSIGANKLAAEAVTQDKIQPGAVGPAQIANSGVATGNLANLSVTEPKLADDAVTRAKAGLGVVTARDTSGNATAMEVLIIAATAHALLGVNEDPNTTYLIWDG